MATKQSRRSSAASKSAGGICFSSSTGSSGRSAARVGELPSTSAGHDDHLVLQALGLVDGHQLDAVDPDGSRALGLEVAADLLVQVELRDEVGPGCRAGGLRCQSLAKRSRRATASTVALRVRGLGGDEVVEQARPDEQLLQQRERSLAGRPRHEVVDDRRKSCPSLTERPVGCSCRRLGASRVQPGTSAVHRTRRRG